MGAPVEITVLALIIAIGGFEESLADPEIQCSWSVEVDELSGSDCSQPGVVQQNNTCNSLQDTLSLVSSSQFPPESCVQVIITQGRYTVEGTIIITRDVLIHGRDGHVVTVELLIQPSNEFQYSLSFRNTSRVVVRNIEFLGSNGVIGFDAVSRVEVSNSSFRYFSQGAVDVYNCLEVTVCNCTFENNGPVVITKFVPVRGHSGGLSMGFYFPQQPGNRTKLTAVIQGSVFRNNSVRASVSGRQSTSQLLTRFLITGRGGGCAIIVHSVISVDVVVTGCMFERNFALSFGGGLYMGWIRVSNHTTTITHTSFIENTCPGGAGGLELGFGRAGPGDTANKFFASDLHFIGNMATYGGGTYVFAASNAIQKGAIGIFASFRDCVFERNVAVEYGGAVGFILPSFNVIFDNRDNIIPMRFDNCSFIKNNGGGGGVVSTSYLPLVFEGNSTFLENRGTSLTILGTTVNLQGQLNFINNDVFGSNGGAVYAISLGQLELAKGSTLLFKNNSGNLGASVVVNTIYVPQLYTRLIYDPLCVLLLEDQSQSFSSVDPNDISVTFSGNKAVVGAAVYTNEIGLCSWTGALGGNREYFNSSLAFRWDFITYSEDNRNSAHFPDDANPLYYVQTEEGKLQVAATNVTAYPGESVPFGVKVIDDLNLPTVAVFRFSDMKRTDILDLEFSPSVISLSRVSQASVNISILTNGSTETRGSTEVIVESLLQKNVDRRQFIINVTSCPPGYVLLKSFTHPHLYHCQCDLENEGIVSCDGLNIQIKDGRWASAASLQTIPCPHMYCRCHMFGGNQRCSNVLRGGNQDSQCACDRQGVLCGSCKDEKGVSVLLHRCVTCNSASVLLIVALIGADTVVYIILILLSMQFPAWLFPCLLYVQTLPFIAENFPSTFGNAYNALYYITSASSFYFAYDFCLLPNLTPLLSYLFRYTPLLVALILCPVTVLIGRYCRHYRGKGWKLKKWHGIWWIVNLMYSHIVHTSLTILNCPKVDVDSNTPSQNQRWYVSGDVECYKGLHLPLALLSIVVVVACFLAIPFTAFLTSKQASVCPNFTSYMLEPLSGSFKSQYSWWSSVELARRFVLILFIVVFPAQNFPTLLVISVFIVATGLTWPYRDIYSTLLDLMLSVDVMLLLLFKNTKQFVDDFSGVTSEKANSSDQCVEHSFQPSTLSRILLPFYYLPLLLCVIAFCVWIVSLIKKRMFVLENDLSDRDIEFSGSQDRYATLTEFTSTELSLRDYVHVDDDFESTISHYNKIPITN